MGVLDIFKTSKPVESQFDQSKIKEIEDSVKLKMDLEQAEIDDIFDSTTLAEIQNALESHYSFSDVVTKLRTLSSLKEDRYKEYGKLAQDPIISEAIEMMSDDATQFDTDREVSVWVTSKDKKYEEKVNIWLLKYVEPYINIIAQQILAYGEFYFKVFEDEEDKERKFVILPYEKAFNITHMILSDGLEFFVEIKAGDSVTKKQEIHEEDAFIHFVAPGFKTVEMKTIKIKKGKGKKAKEEEKVAFILNGEALLTERLRLVHRILTALEDAIIIARMSKSKFVRFITIQVKGMAKKAVQNVVNYVDGLVNKVERVKKSTGAYEASRLATAPVTVVMPIKDEKGRVEVNEYGTTVDIKEIVDLEYFRDIKFVALKIPKIFFGIGEAPFPGIGTSASLLKVDIRYGRAVKKLQRALLKGTKRIVELYNKHHKIDSKDYKVNIVTVITAEDADRTDLIETKLASGQTFYDMIIDEEGNIDSKKIQVMIKYFTDVVYSPEVVSVLVDFQKVTMKSNKGV